MVRPLKLGLFYFEHEKCIDRIESIVFRLTREKPIEFSDLLPVASKIANIFLSPQGANRSISAFKKRFSDYSTSEPLDGDLIFKGMNISAGNRVRHREEREKILVIADAQNYFAIEEARINGVKFQLVEEHRYLRKDGLETNIKRKFKRAESEVKALRDETKQLNKLLKEIKNGTK